MATKVLFTCDICKKDFETKEIKIENGVPKEVPKCVGGMQGFFKRMIPDETKALKEVIMQYNFDLCEECNKKMVNYYLKLGGK